jgi:hypothetical protein
MTRREIAAAEAKRKRKVPSSALLKRSPKKARKKQGRREQRLRTVNGWPYGFEL